MNVTHTFVDLLRHAEEVSEPRPGNLDDLPQAVVERRVTDLWIVAHCPITMDRPIQWYHHKKGSHVVIPMFPYVMAPDPAHALGFMLQLGIRCADSVGRPIRRVHLALGHPVSQFIGDAQLGDGWQFYAGIGIVLE